MPVWVYGIQPILEILRSPEPGIEKIWIAYGRAGAAVDQIRSLARTRKIPVSMRDRLALDLKAGTSKHQGVLALRKQVTGPDLETFLQGTAQAPRAAARFLAMLDGVEDPHNLGAIIRTASAAGVEGLILPRHSVCPVTPVVVKASAGAAHLLTIVQAGNASRALERIRAQGIVVIGADASASQDIYGAAFHRDICLLIGGEGRGIRFGLRGLCDEFVSIPLAGRLRSLNVSVAAGILFYEVVRQRRLGRPEEEHNSRRKKLTI